MFDRVCVKVVLYLWAKYTKLALKTKARDFKLSDGSERLICFIVAELDEVSLERSW